MIILDNIAINPNNICYMTHTDTIVESDDTLIFFINCNIPFQVEMPMEELVEKINEFNKTNNDNKSTHIN